VGNGQLRDRLRELPNDLVRRVLDMHRPELVGSTATTPDERRMVAALLLARERSPETSEGGVEA
jgi:hypothetical protein